MKATSHSKHRNQVRITGGLLRGRKLQFAAAEGLRPTADSVRERLFNWLGQDLTGQTVLDLFAGSGALGFEAASRHARKVVMCEIRRDSARQLAHHTAEFGLQSVIHIQAGDGLAYLQHTSESFDTVLLDPPFAWNGWNGLLAALPERLNDGALVYLEAGVLPDWPSCFRLQREGKAGQSRFVLLHYTANT